MSAAHEHYEGPVPSGDPGVGRFDPQGRVRAAGGVVWRSSPRFGVEVLLVHRPHYDDWTFPKGKRDDGESDEQTAVREVEEETGLRCVPGRELGSVAYTDGQGRSKVARYWEMTVARGDAHAQNEIDEVRWVPISSVADQLSYEHDLDVLRSFSEFAGA